MKKVSLFLASAVAGLALMTGAASTQSASAAEVTHDGDTTTYTISLGETLSQIARDNHWDTDFLAKFNHILNPDKIFAGQKLTMKDDGDTQDVKIPLPFGASIQASVPSQENVAQAQGTIDKVSEVVNNPSQISSALQTLINRESGNNVNASNGDYFGLGQLSSALRSTYGGNSTDYNDQLQAMKGYIADQYGSDEAALAHHDAYGWY